MIIYNGGSVVRFKLLGVPNESQFFAYGVALVGFEELVESFSIPIRTTASVFGRVLAVNCWIGEEVPR